LATTTGTAFVSFGRSIAPLPLDACLEPPAQPASAGSISTIGASSFRGVDTFRDRQERMF
jgi:hypothetical protein